MPLKRFILFCIMLSTFSVAAFATLPGADQYDAGLLKKITNLEKLRGKSYQPRTKHLTDEGKARYTNRLFLESSPYLLQHAHNPVNWYSWGEEAFAAAARLNRPVLLSVGYSTCHWCHVMEEESFEDLEIATYINQHYIAIKVDREERPDIDAIYMAALHAMGQGGGWPMNVWLTADKKPFFGGTYFPPRDGDRGADIGLLTLLKKINKAYHEVPDEVAAVSQNVSKAIKLSLQPVAGGELPALNIMHLAAAYYKENIDHFYGGTGNAPKFPSTTPIQFLLRYYWRTGDKELLKIVELTLTKMAAGGLYDQVGGGFHRYSTDNEWLVPHFEKMLYDNALLSIDYLEAYQVTHNENFRRIVNEILGYIKRDMTSPAGGFYSATDADSLVPSGKREEGYFFTWSADELEQVLGKEAAVIKQYYAVTEQGNFEARNILNTPVSIAEFSEQHGIDKAALLKLISNSKQLLYEQRKKRQPPIRDEKIISAWNGLMISAYAKAGLILNNSDYVQQAAQAADFILNNMFINGRLFRSYKDGVAKHNAYLSDYAFLIAGLLDLYEASSDIKWLKQALLLDTVLESHYEDQQQGGFFLTSNDHEQLLAREKPNYDAAEPTGNSVQILNLFRLGEFTSKQSYKSRGIKALKSFSGILNTNPMALSKMLLAVDFYYDSAKEIIIITAENNKHSADSLIAEFRKQYLPNRVYAVIAEGDELNMQSKIITIAEAKKAIKGRATAYVCKQGACELPTYNAQRFLQQISKKEYPPMKLQKESSD